MRAWGVRLAAAFATLVVLGAGVFNQRELLVEYTDGMYSMTPMVERIQIEAGPGVRVNVEGGGQFAEVKWRTRSFLGRASVAHPEDLTVTARCDPGPTPVSRCTIWVSVYVASPDTQVVILREPGAIVSTDPAGVNAEVRDVP